MRAMGYCEVFLIGGNPITKNLKAAVFNTTDLNNQANSMQTCPADLWRQNRSREVKEAIRHPGSFQEWPPGWMNDSLIALEF